MASSSSSSSHTRQQSQSQSQAQQQPPSQQSQQQRKRWVEEWEGYTANWSDTERQSILLWQEACTELPTPAKFTTASAAVHEPKETLYGESLPNSLQQDESLPPSSTSSTEQKSGDGLDIIKDPIENTQQFFHWFSNIEKEMERGQEDIYRSYLASVFAYQKSCKHMLGDIDTTTQILNGLLENYKSVVDKTQGLQDACEALMEEQSHLATLADDVSEKISYFNELDMITKFLSTPGEDVCFDDRFSAVLDRLDECLDFVSKNPKYKDADLYQVKFRQAMTRAMSIVKISFCNSIRRVGQDIREKMDAKGAIENTNQDPTSSPTTTTTTTTTTSTSTSSPAYILFRSSVTQLQSLIKELEKRVPGHREYRQLLNDCYNTYFSVRRSLLYNMVESTIKKFGAALTPSVVSLSESASSTSNNTPTETHSLDASIRLKTLNSRKEILDSARSGVAYIRQVCIDEYGLFYLFFTEIDGSEDAILNYLDSISAVLYEFLRPVIIQETRLDVLCELCLMLQAYLTGSGEESLPSLNVIKRTLEDVQQKLVFRAQQFIQTDIASFMFGEMDIEVLAKARSTSLLRRTTLTDTNTQGWSSRIIMGSGDWYPPVSRTVWILEKLHKSVNTAVFEDISQEAVEKCRIGLLSASHLVASKQSKPDSQLFLIKNLLALRETIARYDVGFVRKEDIVDLDFSTVRDILLSLLHDRQSIFSATLHTITKATTSLMNPKRMVISNIIDERLALDNDLKGVCEEYIHDLSKLVLDGIPSFLLKISALKMRQEGDYAFIIRNQAFAHQDQIMNLINSFNTNLVSKLPEAIMKLRETIMDERTEGVIIEVIKSNVVEAYTAFYEIVRNEGYESSVMKELWTVEMVTKVFE